MVAADREWDKPVDSLVECYFDSALGYVAALVIKHKNPPIPENLVYVRIQLIMVFLVAHLHCCFSRLMILQRQTTGSRHSVPSSGSSSRVFGPEWTCGSWSRKHIVRSSEAMWGRQWEGGVFSLETQRPPYSGYW